MTKTITIPPKDSEDGRSVYEGTRIELGQASITIRTATAKTIYELVYQLQEWQTACGEEVIRLRRLCEAVAQTREVVVSEHWVDTGEETTVKCLSELYDMWERACEEQERKRDTYEDAWTYLATLLDEQEPHPLDTKTTDWSYPMRKLLMDAGRHADSEDPSLRAWWGGVNLALAVFDRAADAGWGVYRPEFVDTDPYFD